MACARRHARAHVTVANPLATNAANPTTLHHVYHAEVKGDDFRHEMFAVTMTSRLVLNALPTKLGAGCVVSVARKIAQEELEECAISERMGSSNFMLEGICKAITSPGEYQLDAVWASWVLIVYLCCHPEGRVLLRKTTLTDVDYQTATAFEQYGRAEITRRARLEAQQTQSRKRKAGSPASSGPRNEGAKADVKEDAVDVSAMDQMSAEENKVLATKRKRGTKSGGGAASTSDSSGMLQWWYGALRCDNASVLMTLVAYGKQAAKDAACQTLEKQAAGSSSVAQHHVLRGISEQNAMNARQALVPFVGRRADEMPALLSWAWKGKTYHGMSRVQDEARSTTLHGCYMAPSTLQPNKDTQMVFAWSVVSIQYAPKSSECLVLPGILERLQDTVQMRDRGKRGELVASRVGAMVLGEAEPPRPTAMSGITRSIISTAIFLGVNESEAHIAWDLSQQLVGAGLVDGEVPSSPPHSLPTLIANELNPATRREPLCTPASRLALGIALNEELRTWMMGKTRKNDPTKVMLGVASAHDRARDTPAIVNAEPPPLLTIVDINLDLTENGEKCLYNWGNHGHKYGEEEARLCKNVEFDMALHVCGDGATRVPEMLKALKAECLTLCDFVRQARSTIWGAMSQASYICKLLRSRTPAQPVLKIATAPSLCAANVGPTISAGYANTAISSSKKISVRYAHFC